jgi:multidrug efflux pump subunit AcrA (membrane-fusion protein)
MSTAWLTIPGVLRPQAAAAAPAAGEVEFTEPAGRLSRLPFPHWSTAAWLRAALGLLAVLSVIGCKEEPAAQQEVVRPVKVAVVAMTAPGHTLTYSGVVRSRIESALGFRVPGKIVERVVNVGDRVAVGQPIARLDDTDLNLSESSARAAVVGARSRRDMARDNLERAKVLLPKRIIAQATYDTRHNEFDAAVSALDSAEAQLRQAANAVSYATLKADKAGIVTAVTAEPGQVVSAGQPVITLAHADEMEIAIAVPEQDAGYLTIGQPAKITLWAAGVQFLRDGMRVRCADEPHDARCGSAS